MNCSSTCPARNSGAWSFFSESTSVSCDPMPVVFSAPIRRSGKIRAYPRPARRKPTHHSFRETASEEIFFFTPASKTNLSLRKAGWGIQLRPARIFQLDPPHRCDITEINWSPSPYRVAQYPSPSADSQKSDPIKKYTFLPFLVLKLSFQPVRLPFLVV